jgi:23S rRNA (adenine2503-C2)-methyltransferase
MTDVLGLGSEEFAEAAKRSVPETAGLAARIYARIFKTGILDAAAEGASERNARLWKDSFEVGLLQILDRLDTEGHAGTTTKLVFGTRDGHRIEAVSIPMYGGTRTLCVSSQVGCCRACAFCETGRLGLVRDLRAGEIVSQVLSASLALGVRFRNIVFMGMGEPLDNLENVARALAVFADRRAFAYSMERMTVCTSGDAAGIEALSRLGLKRLNLSVSLNAADDRLRDDLMPVNRVTPLARLSAVLASYPKRRNFVLGVNYCLLPGLNDGDGDAEGVARFCASVGRALVNLIPYNPGRHPIARAPTEEEIDRFLSKLIDRGVPVRLRVEKGRSVMAACGQLGGS